MKMKNYDDNMSDRQSEMTTSNKPPLLAKFADMKLQVGQRLLLILEGAGTHKQYTNIIGWVESEFLMLRVPHENGWVSHVREGMNLEIRLFSGLSIFNFRCRVNNLLLHPRNYMLVSFPKEIHETPMREHKRVLTSLGAEILNSQNIVANKTDFQLRDISTAGTSVVGPQKLGDIDSSVHLRLRFDLQSTGKCEEVEIVGKIQNMEPIHHSNKQDAHPQYRHGIKFDQADVKIALLVHELEALSS
jgi:hypothetical protein